MARGGRREGSGRKALAPEQKKIGVSAYVTPETLSKIDKLKERGLTLGEWIEQNI